ncbi:hypothetical protein ACHAXT_000204 [Thalassiosira profunda]
MDAPASSASGRPPMPRRPPSSSLAGAPTPAPTPILKSSCPHKRKRRQAGKRPSALQFSQDVVILEPKTTGEEQEEEVEESDTDVGSGDDEEFSLGESEAVDFGVDFGAALGQNVGACTNGRGEAGTPPSVSRAVAKVRRLNLGEDDDDGQGMDVAKSRSSFERDGGGGSPLGSPARKPHGGTKGTGRPRPAGLFGGGEFGSPPASPINANGNPRGDMPICPPSTAKPARGVSRLFTGASGENDSPNFGELKQCDAFEEEEEDVSPRDVVEFPFFAASPSGKSGQGDFQENLTRVDSLMENGSPTLPQCPPSATKKKPNRRAMDLNNTDGMRDRSAPKGLRSLGRANSFLQMFSQEAPAEGLKKIAEEEENESDDGDDFLSRPRENTNDDVQMTCPSPRRPVRSHRRFAPDSPEKNEPLQATSASSFSRFAADFEVVGTLGNGAFGHVYKVRHRTDRRMYAIKAARREARGASDRDRMLREVYALAALSDQAGAEGMHIVRYYQAWMEGNRLYIQTELCETTLQEEMRTGVLKDERRRYKLLREMALALDLVHKSGLIHLDLKPDNIFVKGDRYKLGDFGLVSKIENHDDVEEGDSRYMSMELLSGDLDDLTKSDIFSLGATMYEICLGREAPLPENGPEWQDMRRGNLLRMPHTPFDLQMIVREMMAPERQDRPSAEELLKKRQLLSDEQRQLITERNKAKAANKALDVQMQRFKQLSPQERRMKFNRSHSLF